MAADVGLREVMHNALADARDVVGDVVQQAAAGAQLTDDELLARYEQHRQDPVAKVEFTRQRTGLQGDALIEEALRYEAEMEKLWSDRGGA